MYKLDLDQEERQVLLTFIEEEPRDRAQASTALEELLGKIMGAIDVRRLESVKPDEVRNILQCVFELFKARHLLENHFLSHAQYRARLGRAKDSLSAALGGSDLQLKHRPEIGQGSDLSIF